MLVPSVSLGTRLVLLLSTLTLSVPGLELGLAYVLAFKQSPLYETMGILILSSTVHFFTTPYLMLYQAFGKLNANLEGTGQVLGIPPVRLFVNVFLPQCEETLADMAAYFFLNANLLARGISFLLKRRLRRVRQQPSGIE